MHGSQPGCFTLRSMLLEDFVVYFLFSFFFWWGGGKPMRFCVSLNRSKEDLFLYNAQGCGLNIVSGTL